MPLVSIITPTYNHAGLIGECIESVLAQTFGDWEMLVVDDGSTDGTPDVVRRYDDPRVRLFEKPNGGIMNLHESYNLALRNAGGSLLAILEGDDYWPPNKLEIQVPEFDDPGVVLVSGFAMIVDEDYNEIGRIPTPLMPEDVRLNRPVGQACRAMMMPEFLNFTFPVATMLRKTAVENIGGFLQLSGLPLIDYPTYLAMGLEGEFRFVQRTCGFWRRHSASVTSSRLPAILEGCYRETMRFARAEKARLRLSEDDIRGIAEDWEVTQAKRLTLLGMMLASEGRTKEASRAFRMSNRFRRPRRTRALASVIGLAAALGVRRLGWAYRMAYRPAPNAIWEHDILRGGDPVVRAEDLDREWPVH